MASLLIRPPDLRSSWFSNRTRFNRTQNRLSAALAQKRRSHARILDLTESNPTRAGLTPPLGLLSSLSNAAALQYDPRPFGLVATRDAVTKDFERRGHRVPVEHIALTASTSEAYGLLFKLLCDPGDTVLVLQPSYPLFEYLAGLESVRTAPYLISHDGEWHVDFAALRLAIDERCRVVIAVHPNNPTGSYLKHAEAETLARLCCDHGLALISDEVFFDFSHGADARRAGSLITNDAALVFTLGGLSKSCGLPQMKLGWIAVGGPSDQRDEALARLEIVADTYLSVGTPIQIAAPHLLAHLSELQTPILHRIRRNLRHIEECLGGLSPLTLLAPEGGWSAAIRVPATLPEEELVVHLLDAHDVLVHPGYFFDFPHEAFIVVSLLPQPELFDEALKRLVDAVATVLT